MDFLRAIKLQRLSSELSSDNKEEKRKFQPLKYLVALILLLIVTSVLFSLKPSVQAFAYLPEDTSFYWQWADKPAISGNFDDFQLLDFSQSQASLSALQTILQETFMLSEEIIWFKQTNSETDNFLLKLTGTLSKEELKLLATQNQNMHFKLLAKDVLLISPDQSLAERLQINATDKFSQSLHHEGINIYLAAKNFENFVKVGKILTLDFSLEADVFVHLDSNKFDVYQTQSQEQASAWQGLVLPDKAKTILAFAEKKLENKAQWQALLSADIFTALPESILDRPELQDQQILFWENRAGEYLLASRQNFSEVMTLFIDNLPLEAESRLLPDGTSYQALVLADLVWQELAWPGQKAWQVANMFVLEQGGFYYLSNSEQLLKSLATQTPTTDSAKCLQPSESLIDWFFLDKQGLISLKLADFIPKEADLFQSLTYSTQFKRGLRLCW